MKGIVILLVMLHSCIFTDAQSRFGAEIGIGAPPPYGPGLGNMFGPYESQKSATVPCFGISYMNKVGRHIFVGAKVFYNTYSFTFKHSELNNLFDLFVNVPVTTTSTEVTCKNHYISLAPLIDLGVGKRQYIHFFLMPGIGILANGNMSTYGYTNNPNPGTAPYDYYANTTSYLNKNILQVSYGMTEHFPLNKMWHLTLTETLCNQPSGLTLADPKGTGDISLNRSYLSLQLGVMRKYRHTHYGAEKS